MKTFLDKVVYWFAKLSFYLSLIPRVRSWKQRKLLIGFFFRPREEAKKGLI